MGEEETTSARKREKRKRERERQRHGTEMGNCTEKKLKTMKELLAKSDGRDKLCATIQYALMFIHAGQAGKVKKVQGNIASARKVFRVFKPVEVLTPMITDPWGTKAAKSDDPKMMFLVKRAQMLLMALYFGGDHLVWAKSSGILEDAETANMAKKVSMYSWFGGSVCKALVEMFEPSKLVSNTNAKLKSLQDREGEEAEDERRETRAKADAMALKRTFTVCHAFVQATLALGLVDA